MRISEKEASVEYRIKKLTPRSFTLKDFEFNGCDYFSGMEMLRIGSAVSVISSFLAALEEDLNNY